jgi:hypothetical protein
MNKIIPPVTVDPNQRYALPEAAAILRISRSQLYEDIAEDRIRIIKAGRRTYIHGSELIRCSAMPADLCAA